MLEWLKNILGESYTEDIDKQISAEISKSFVAKSDFDAADEARKAAETQLAEATKTIADWQAKSEQAQKDADARVDEVKFDARLDRAIAKRRGRSAKAIKAMLDVDALRASKDQDKDIDAALDALAQDSTYLFEPLETPPPYAAGTGSGTVSRADKTDDGVEIAFAALNPNLKF
ncbi:MAG: phage scaffolding protein [Blautia massiliensis (ex Durand et al. 2017)]